MSEHEIIHKLISELMNQVALESEDWKDYTLSFSALKKDEGDWLVSDVALFEGDEKNE